MSVDAVINDFKPYAMKPSAVSLASLLVAAALLATSARASACNEAVCASVVSKCMLTQSCKCDLTHCSCCRDCFNCLSYLYNECCACVDMCNGVEEVAKTISDKSYVEELASSVPGLFAALTADLDNRKFWRPMSFPMRVSDISLQSVEEDASHEMNCTVAYLSQCMSWKKCKASCETMGSSCYRWFRDGCCECIGENCRNYGSEESRCLACSKGEATDVEDLSEDDFDYGEDVETQETDAYA